MTTEEFSNEFDSLLNSYSNNLEFGHIHVLECDEYEKSVFLTKAQEDIVKELYNGKNPYGDSFEKTEELRRYLSNLIKTKKYDSPTNTNNSINESEKLYSNSILFTLPSDVWFITYESVDFEDDSLGCKNGTNICVVPVTQDDFSRIMKNPFRGPNERRVLRLDADNGNIELISKYNIKNYIIRYLKQPNPIILIDLPVELQINGEHNKTECELNPVIHRTILERAVKLALLSRVSSAGK